MFHFHKICLPNKIPVLVKYICKPPKYSLHSSRCMFCDCPWREATLQLCVLSPILCSEKLLILSCAWVVELQYSMCACDEEILTNLVLLHATWQRLIESKKTSWRTYPHVRLITFETQHEWVKYWDMTCFIPPFSFQLYSIMCNHRVIETSLFSMV